MDGFWFSMLVVVAICAVATYVWFRLKKGKDLGPK